jgi:GrpB-like predicted nucleotidyltransferase (UPF0157 family)
MLKSKQTMEIKDKYIFRPYSHIFPKLFDNESARLREVLGPEIKIDHIGSTAIPGLEGKGVIDILLIAPKSGWAEISEKLKTLGYEYKKKGEERENQRLFFMVNLPDRELGSRIYHIHLTYPGSSEEKRSLGFRNYLRAHPEEAREYAEIKRMAAEEAQKLSTKDEMRDTYGKSKEAFIQKILEKI